MLIAVKRDESNDECTLGKLFIDGDFFCYTIEPPVRDKDTFVKDKTAIFDGTYNVNADHRTWNQHLYSQLNVLKDYFTQKEKPEIAQFCSDKKLPQIVYQDVLGDTGYLLHIGNFPNQTHGCIMVGKGKGANKVISSTDAFKVLYEKIVTAYLSNETVQIKISSSLEDMPIPLYTPLEQPNVCFDQKPKLTCDLADPFVEQEDYSARVCRLDPFVH